MKWGYGMKSDIMTVKQAAEKWGIKPRRVEELIRGGRIKDVYKIGTTWVMPADTQKPNDLRKERYKNKQTKTAEGGCK